MIDSIQPPRPSASTASPRSLEQDLEQATRESVDYQILRRTLGIEQEPSEQVADELRQASEAPEAALQAEAFSRRLVEQRSLELQVNAEPVPQQIDPLVLGTAFPPAASAVRYVLTWMPTDVSIKSVFLPATMPCWHWIATAMAALMTAANCSATSMGPPTALPSWHVSTRTATAVSMRPIASSSSCACCASML